MYRCMQVNYGGCMLHATIGNEGEVVPAKSVIKGYMRGMNGDGVWDKRGEVYFYGYWPLITPCDR